MRAPAGGQLRARRAQTAACVHSQEHRTVTTQGRRTYVRLRPSARQGGEPSREAHTQTQGNAARGGGEEEIKRKTMGGRRDAGTTAGGNWVELRAKPPDARWAKQEDAATCRLEIIVADTQESCGCDSVHSMAMYGRQHKHIGCDSCTVHRVSSYGNT